ncbi:major facilitator superfamily domain-containing protein [Elsinoe ampelina]|uniref:Major facilitator superfamily domain-containing protein n=1 Tax=Elsinoe ampelina TaxID=302913 RepID=A0A6A6FZU3_9PEZI|nr:major facilitator superfamily domain-containing protein [Elsinoe ampelina]
MVSFKEAFALPKSEVDQATPPGTSQLIDNELVRTETGHHEHTEKHIHLQPEPSADPADPLNFAQWRKYAILALMSVYAFISNTQSAIVSSAFPKMVTAWAVFSERGPPTGIVPFPRLVYLISVNSLMLGASNLLWVPLSNTFGRRPIILVCLLLLTVCSIWAAEAKSFNSLLAARVFTGMGGAAADTLAPDVVGQIFFVHERGRSMAVYTIFLTAGSLVGGVVGGYIAYGIGWRWTMWLHVILAGAVFLGCLFFLPETLFDRESALAAAHDETGNGSDIEKEKTGTIERINSQVFPPYTFSRSIGFMKPRPGIFGRFITPFKTLRYPGTIMVCLHYAGLVGLIVTISSVGPQILVAPPYLWGANAGLLNIGGLVGAILGAIYTYFTADWITKRAARKEQHGYAEPEKRLPLMIPALVIATGGSLVFGFVAQNPSPNGWVGLNAGMGMVAFGLMQVPSIGFNYIIESYGRWASDCFLMVVSFRAIISFAWTFFVGEWVTEAGAAVPFGVFAALMAVFGLTVVPVWLFGKRMRIATADWVGTDKKFY